MYKGSVNIFVMCHQVTVNLWQPYGFVTSEGVLSLKAMLRSCKSKALAFFIESTHLLFSLPLCLQSSTFLSIIVVSSEPSLVIVCPDYISVHSNILASRDYAASTCLQFQHCVASLSFPPTPLFYSPSPISILHCPDFIYICSNQEYHSDGFGLQQCVLTLRDLFCHSHIFETSKQLPFGIEGKCFLSIIPSAGGDEPLGAHKQRIQISILPLY